MQIQFDTSKVWYPYSSEYSWKLHPGQNIFGLKSGVSWGWSGCPPGKVPLPLTSGLWVPVRLQLPVRSGVELSLGRFQAPWHAELSLALSLHLQWLSCLFELGMGREGCHGVCDTPGRAEMGQPGSLQGTSLKVKMDSVSFSMPWETRLGAQARNQKKFCPFLPFLLLSLSEILVISSSEIIYAISGLWKLFWSLRI